jgi:hypothetical protein
MRAYEFPTKITSEGNLQLPDALQRQLPNDQEIRVIILVPESTDTAEDANWERLTAEQFLAGYDETDAVYDNI